MNRFGCKLQESQSSIDALQIQEPVPFILPSLALFNQQLGQNLFNARSTLRGQFSVSQSSYETNNSDDEDFEEQEINLLLQQNQFLSSLISEIERDIGHLSSNLQKDNNNQASEQSVSIERRRRTTNGINKTTKTTTLNKNNGSTKILRTIFPKKLSKRKLLLKKKLNVSRKIAERLFKSQLSE